MTFSKTTIRKWYHLHLVSGTKYMRLPFYRTTQWQLYFNGQKRNCGTSSVERVGGGGGRSGVSHENAHSHISSVEMILRASRHYLTHTHTCTIRTMCVYFDTKHLFIQWNWHAEKCQSLRTYHLKNETTNFPLRCCTRVKNVTEVFWFIPYSCAIQ